MEFEDLFHTYYSPLYNYAYVILKNERDAEDVVQEVFVDVWDKGSFKQLEQPDRYLLRAVKFKSINLLQRLRSKEANFSDIYQEELVLPDPSEFKEDDILPLLHFFAAKLPQKTQEIFLLSRKNGLTYKEIAEERGISIKTVETQMSRALKILRKLVAEHYLLLALLSKI
ncbi:RNA polymerase sigma-70 factor [Ekhidna sp.]|uniref:RNA polymerase sigma-70 factor n=1 Tax=Ekhidna sp. TaxID=2608089 RepID=UPI00329A157D